MDRDLVRMSRFLARVLRHEPESIGLVLDAHGWADVDDLVRLAAGHGVPLTRPLLERIVAENDKRRFALGDDGRRIRASQGHSVAIDLALPPAQPPTVLYHGTASRSVASIRAGGLHPARRRHVHLSPDVPTATSVGQRHGRAVVLVVRAGAMAAAGHTFFLSANGVWLTARVPAEFIKFPER